MGGGVISSPCHRMHLLRAKQGTITIRAAHAEQNHDQPNNLSWVYQPHHAMPGHIVTHPDCSDRQDEGNPRNFAGEIQPSPDQASVVTKTRWSLHWQWQGSLLAFNEFHAKWGRGLCKIATVHYR